MPLVSTAIPSLAPAGTGTRMAKVLFVLITTGAHADLPTRVLWLAAPSTKASARTDPAEPARVV